MSILFNGTSDSAWGRFATPMLNTSNAFTLYVMFRTPSVFTASVILSTSLNVSGANDVGRGYELSMNASGRLRVTSSTSGGYTNTGDIGYLLPDTTYRAIFTKTSGSPNVTIYLGNSSTSITATGMAESNANLQGLVFGKSATYSSSYFGGQIEDVAVWRSVLSVGDLDTLFDPKRRPSDTGVTPDDYWSLVSSDTAVTAGTYALVRSGPAIAASTLITAASSAPHTYVLGSTDVSAYTANTLYGGTGEYVQPAFVAGADATIFRLGIDVSSFYSSNACRLSLRDSGGNLLTTGLIGNAGLGSLTVEVPTVNITAGQTYYITVSFAGNLQFKGNARSAGYINYKNTGSTYAAPLAQFTIAGNMTGRNDPMPHVWAEGSLGASDVTPDAFVFSAATGVECNATTTSTAQAVTGVTGGIDLAISIANGEYSINGGVWRTAAYTVKLADTVAVRRSSSTAYSTLVSTTVTVGGVASTFNITTRAADTIPTAFSFTDATNAQPSTVTVSDVITVAGIDSNVTTPISITGGEFAISTDGGGTYTAFDSTSTTVALGNMVKVRGTSNASYSGVTNVVLTIGTVTDTFTITTVASAIPTINVLSSSNIVDTATGFTLSTFNIASATGITIDGRAVTGFTGSANSYGFNAFTLANGATHPRYGAGRTLAISSATINVTVSPKPTQGYVTLTAVNSSAPFIGSYVTTAIGDQIVFDLPATLSTATNGVDATGRIVSSYTSTQSFYHISASTGLVTKIDIVAPDCIPNTPVFTAQVGITPLTTVVSNTITVAGATANQPLDITVTNGEYSIDAGVYVSTPGTVVNGQTVTVRCTAPSSYSSTSNTTLTISGVNAVFAVTTLTPDITIDPLGFVDATGLEINAVVESNVVTVAGVTPNYDVPVSVAGGELTISTDGGGTWSAYISTPTNVRLGNKLKVRGTTSNWYSFPKVVQLQIGTGTEIFTYTTRAAPTVALSTDYIAIDGAVNTLTVANLPDANVMTLDGIAIPTLSGSGTTYQFTIPTLADGINTALYGTKLLRLSKNAIFANVYVQLAPKPTQIYTTLTSVNTAVGYLGNYLTCAVGDQVVYNRLDANSGINAIGVDGRISVDYAGSQIFYHIRASDGLVTQINLSGGIGATTVNLTGLLANSSSPKFDALFPLGNRP